LFAANLYAASSRDAIKVVASEYCPASYVLSKRCKFQTKNKIENVF